jgi:hypothetical protein
MAAPVTWETVRQLALALPGVEEGTSYGTPALKVRGKLLVLTATGSDGRRPAGRGAGMLGHPGAPSGGLVG